MRASKAWDVRWHYWQLLWGYTGPAKDQGWTNETAPPYRYGLCTVRRVGRTPLALVVGRWEGPRKGPEQLHQLLRQYGAHSTEANFDTALRAATEARVLDEKD